MKKKILVVEDEPHISKLVKFILEKNGFEVMQAFVGQEGIEMAKREKPGLIVLDVMMPNMDGFEMCQRLRADPTTVEIPIAILSALSSLVDQTAGLELGVSRYLIKPVSINQLAKVIDELVATGEVAISAER